jgi:hypothetical protein
MAPKSETEMSAAHVPQLSVQQTDPIAQRALEMEYSHLTQEALDDVDAGRVVCHQAVRAWAERLLTDRASPERP